MVSNLLRGAVRLAPSVLTRFFGAALQFAVNVFLGRILGPAGLGTYYTFDAWQRTLGLVVSVGMPSLSLRTVSRLVGRGDRGAALRAFVRYLRVVLVTASLVGGVVVLTSGFLTRWLANSSVDANVLAWAGGSAVLFALVRMLAQALKGSRRPAWALAVEFVLLPAGILAVVGVALTVGVTLDAGGIVIAHVGALVVAACVGALLLRRFLYEGEEPARGLPSERESASTSTLAYFWGASVVQMLFTTTPILMLPFYGSQAEIGQYGAATKLLAVSGVAISALASYFSPRFATHANDPRRLRRLLRASQYASLMLFAPFFVLFMFAPAAVLQLFGPTFAEGVPLLRILALGQLVASGSGLVGYFAGMIGLERDAFASVAVALAALVLLTHALGSTWGVVGVAVGYAVAVTIRSGILMIVAAVRLRGSRPERVMRDDEDG